MHKRSTYRTEVQQWVDCLTETAATLVRIRGPLKVELMHAELTEQLQNIRRITRLLETCDHERVPKLINEREFSRLIVRQLFRGIRRFPPHPSPVIPV